MEKLFFFTFMLIGLTISTSGQEISKNTIGFRLGSSDGFGAEISYQRKLLNSNRLELDLGWRNNNYINAIKIAGIYQWVWEIRNDFNWFAGVGAGLGSRNKYKNGFIDDKVIYPYATGDVGIEYNFDFPLQLSLDLRPELYSLKNDGVSFDTDIGLGIRYKF